MAKKKKGSGLLWVVIIVLALFLLKDRISFGGGNSDACGKREVNEDRSGYCLTTSSDYDGLIVITGNTANSPAPNLDFENGELNDILSGVFYGDSDTTIISAAGNNSTIDIRKYTPRKNLNASKNNLKKLSKEINEAIKQSPSESGANYFGAILKAGNIIESQKLKRPVIVVVGSGYSDRGVLNFASDDILGRYARDGNANGLVSGDKSVKEGMLNGVTIKWYNAAEVSPPQSEISAHYQALTREIYTELFGYLGATSEILGDTGIGSDRSSVDTKYTVGQVYVERLRKGDTFSVNEDVGRFKPDTNELINREEVKDRLRSFATQFDSSGNLRLKITGYIAFCEPGSTLGEARAATIRDILVELGVPYDRIDVFGQPGAPSDNSGEAYTCNSDLPETERRTVRIEVVEG